MPSALFMVEHDDEACLLLANSDYQLDRTEDRARSVVQKVFFHFICDLGQISISVSLCVVVTSLGGCFMLGDFVRALCMPSTGELDGRCTDGNSRVLKFEPWCC